jgi:predicted ATP-dependent endonuclease of OLD family
MNGFDNFKGMIIKAAVQEEICKETLNEKNKELTVLKKEYRELKKIKRIFQTVGESTQSKMLFEIEKFANLAFEIVFDGKYRVEIKQGKRADKSIIEFVLIDNRGNEVSPKNNVGVGAIDIFSFSMLISMWLLKNDSRKSKTFLLDEPFAHLSKKYQSKVSELLNKLSKELGIQFIIVSHQKGLIESANKVFTVEIENGISNVREENVDVL